MERLPDCADLMRAPDSAAEKIRERARREQWDVERDIDWAALDLEALAPSVRSAMAALYTQILFGEMVALHESAKVVRSTSHAWVRSYALTQVTDEARHVEFFSRIVTRLGGEVPVLDRLRRFASELDAVDSIDDALLGTQVIIESFAQTIFLEGARATNAARARAVRLPGADAAAALMEHLIERVGKDESRHVAFGVAYLRRRVKQLGHADRSRLERRAHEWSETFDAFLLELSAPFTRLGLSAPAIRARAEETRRKHLATVFSADDTGHSDSDRPKRLESTLPA